MFFYTVDFLYKIITIFTTINISLAFVIAVINICLSILTCLIIERIPYLCFLVGLKRNCSFSPTS